MWYLLNKAGLSRFFGSRNASGGLACASATLVAVCLSGCQQPDSGVAQTPGAQAVAHRTVKEPVRHVLCLYEQTPWLKNLDVAGDADPEGIGYRVYLLDRSRKGKLCDGTFHVDMYQIVRTADGNIERELVSDWHYPTTTFPTVQGILGKGYRLGLRWATKSIAGSEIDITTRFEDVDGRSVRSGTKRLRVPKYTP